MKSLLDHRLERILKLQNSDGTWGDRITLLGDHWIDETGLTGLVLVAFLQSGYSHLSSDHWDGIRVGTALKNGLFALMRAQAADGTFATSGDALVNQCLATWALCEAYGMSATGRFKEPAQQAVKAAGRHFSSTSGWRDDETSAWAALSLASARLSELDVDEKLIERTREFAASSPASGSGSGAAVAWAVLRGAGQRAAELKGAAELARNRPVQDDLVAGLFDSIVIFHFEGSKGEGWDIRSGELAKRLVEREELPKDPRTDSAAMLRDLLEALHLSLRFWYPPERLETLGAPAVD
jgi:hypothetical protein